MDIKTYIKKNKFFSILTLIFATWGVFLIILTIINQKTVIFWESISNTDVSSDYMIILPILRYFLEPIAQLSFTLEMEFSWMFLFFIIYPILRILYLILRKKGRFQSEKYKLLTIPLADIIKFSFKVLTTTMLIIGLIMLFGYLIQGYFFVSRYFMIPVQIGVYLCIILIVIKTLYVLLKLFHPKLQFSYSKKKSRGHKNKKLKNFKKELVYLIGIGSILLGINIVIISFPFPTQSIIPTIPLEDDEFLFDFHIHSIYSDGWLTPEERVLWYIEQGISGAAFSDHDNIRGALAAQQFVEANGLNFLVFMAEEWTDNDNDIHMNYYGIAEELMPIQYYTPGGPLALNISDTIDYVKSHGGYITVNHYNTNPNPNGGYGVPYNLTQLRDWGVDGFEIINGGSYGGKYQQIRDFCNSSNLICIGGSDIHTNEPLNTFVKIKLADPLNLTITNIFETMKTNKNHEVIAININPKIVDFPNDLNDLGFYIFEDFINYFLNMDTYQSISWMVWSGGIYVIIFLLYRKVKKVDLGLLKRKIS